jgi:hypothetical protein
MCVFCSLSLLSEKRTNTERRRAEEALFFCVQSSSLLVFELFQLHNPETFVELINCLSLVMATTNGMMWREVDMRSDTVTKPTAEMREAMKNAVVGKTFILKHFLFNLIFLQF